MQCLFSNLIISVLDEILASGLVGFKFPHSEVLFLSGYGPRRRES